MLSTKESVSAAISYMYDKKRDTDPLFASKVLEHYELNKEEIRKERIREWAKKKIALSLQTIDGSEITYVKAN